MTKVVGDTNVIGNEINGLFSAIIQAPIVMIFSSVVLFMIDVPLGITSVVTIYLLSFILIAITSNYKKRTTIVRTTISDINGDVIDRIGAIRLIKSSATREYEYERIKQIHKPYLKSFKPLAKTGGLLLQTLIVCDAIVNIIVISVGVFWYGYIQNDINIFLVKLIPIVSCLTQLTRPLWQISGIIPGIARAGASTEKVMEIVTSEILLDDNFTSGKQLDQEVETIEFKNVYFRYPKKKK
ncbi:ABC transporter ATP-binding protein/permease [Spiroplasma clarkii]|uniref:ABC transporter transmembrane domain-containing protein n=1 Tax=Spiroplasma clarkii TaxID=2139 RepID=UPI000B5839B3|nr:ABC transporter ATP-binding protein [Spiroplasma clarkii]ARU91369.1 ABC transporter ATP-binding protein/permease [Spiroplasma clarkii]